MIKFAKKILSFAILNTVLVLSGCAYQPQTDELEVLERPNEISKADATLPPAPPKLLDGASFFHILLAELALLNDRPDVALELLLVAWEDHPSDVALLERLAPLAARWGNPQLALRLYQSWAEADPQNRQTWQGLWQIALNQQSPEAASLAVQNLLRLNPNTELNIPYPSVLNWPAEDALALYLALTDNELGLTEKIEGLKLLGVLLHQSDQPNAAQQYWDALAQNLSQPEEQLSYAQSLYDLGLLAASWTVISPHPNPNEPAVLLLKARILEQQNQPEMALELLIPLIDNAQGATELLLLGAELAMQTDHPRRDAWLEALSNTSEADSARLMRAELAINQGQYEAARALLNQIRAVELSAEATTQLVRTLEQSPLPEAAVIELFEQWRHRFANGSIRVLEQQARYWYDLGAYERAYDAYSLGLRINPNDFFLLYMRALSAEPLGWLESLEQDLRRILLLEPNNTAALNALGYTLIDRTDRIEEAAPLIEQAYAQNPDSFAITDTLGWLRFKQGRYDEAVKILARALAMQDETLDDDEVVSHYVEALWRNGQLDQAKAVAHDWLERFTATQRLQNLLDELGISH
jgi:tetratricopeptide (TPR) repeat protein